jgi:hypothetical protein
MTVMGSRMRAFGNNDSTNRKTSDDTSDDNW